MVTEIRLPAVIERDVDLLLMEEITASQDFLHWFLHKIGLKERCQLLAVSHSAMDLTGETDIEIKIGTAQGTKIVLIENKIAAGLQPSQPERYRERATRYVEQGLCETCVTVLVAPRAYLGDKGLDLGFDHAVTYEDILRWLASTEDLGPRAQFKTALLRCALDRGSAVWKPVPNQAVTEFWRQYWELARNLAPELRMPKPEAKPARSGFIYFKPAGLPRGVSLVHKVPHGRVDLQFANQATAIDSISRQYHNLLEPGMTVEVVGKSVAIRIPVPQIDMRAAFGDIEAAAREGIWAAKLLNIWRKRVGL